MHYIPSDVAFWALLILVQIHRLKNRLFHQRIDMFCAVFYHIREENSHDGQA